jgi:putative Holliday junction resolvase
MRILALDVGEKNIGLAISDELGYIAQGFASLKHESKDKSFHTIANIAKEQSVKEIVVGMPINLDGSLGKKAKEVAIFVEELKKKINIPIKIWDERFSSLQAEKVMLEADMSRKKRKRNVDKLAAQLVLQSYLDASKHE